MKIQIRKDSMNPHYAKAYGLILKLTYTFPNHEAPHVEAFPDNEMTQSEEWHIYGAKSESESLVKILKFTGLNEPQDFELEGKKLKITFIDLTRDNVDYLRGGSKSEFVYHFKIDQL